MKMKCVLRVVKVPVTHGHVSIHIQVRESNANLCVEIQIHNAFANHVTFATDLVRVFH